MARYYLALVQGIIHNEVKEALQNIILCLSENVLMAEFWCLLGDIFIKLDKFDYAVAFYENAILLGSRRLKLDTWPMQISKYQEYPNKMIEECNKLIQV
jgi:cytochrome c-type biogenesis protein CcmH/NrfG